MNQQRPLRSPNNITNLQRATMTCLVCEREAFRLQRDTKSTVLKLINSVRLRTYDRVQSPPSFEPTKNPDLVSQKYQSRQPHPLSLSSQNRSTEKMDHPSREGAKPSPDAREQWRRAGSACSNGFRAGNSPAQGARRKRNRAEQRRAASV